MRQELPVGPSVHRLGIDPRAVLFLEGLPGLCERLSGQVGQLRVLDDLGGPVEERLLRPDGIDLLDGEGFEVLADTGVVVSLPGDWDPLWRGWNLEDDHTAAGMVDLMNAAEGQVRHGAIEHLLLG
jgi:hypothetical protein